MTARGPRFPVYIPSKSRADVATTPGALDALGVPYRIVVEEQQRDAYASRWGADRLLILPRRYQDEYDPCIPGFDSALSKGSGPARNFIWDHAVGEGHAWHWVMDDNIRIFCRLNRNRTHPVGDGTMFAAMEDFVLRYRNVAMAGPQYFMFASSRSKAKPFILNTRIFSCNLIRNDVPFRWRGRYNEDLDLSIRMLKAGWCTVLFMAFLQQKLTTQTLPGGNTEAFYAEEGTRLKSELIVRLHPDVCKPAVRYGRHHHTASFARWKNRPLVPRDDAPPPDGDPYAMALVPRERKGRPAPSPGRDAAR